MSSLLARLLLGLLAAVAVWESLASLRPPRITDGEVRALAAVVRAQYQAGELIAVAPAWLSPLVQRELGDLMPVEHLARPDGKRFARISEVALPPFGLFALDRLFPPARTGRLTSSRNPAVNGGYGFFPLAGAAEPSTETTASASRTPHGYRNTTTLDAR